MSMPQQMPISRAQFAAHQFDALPINPFGGLSAISPTNLSAAGVEFHSRSSTSCSVLTNGSSNNSNAVRFFNNILGQISQKASNLMLIS
jgi:hypothetical protein